MEVRDTQGDVVPIQDLPKGLILTSMVQIRDIPESSLDDICFAYSTAQDDDWSCLNNSKLEETMKKE